MSENDTETGGTLGADLTQHRSLDVLARALSRHRPNLPLDMQPHVSILIRQCKNFAGNPDGLRPLMLISIDRIEALQRR